MKESAGEPAGALREGYTEPVSHATHVRAGWLLAGTRIFHSSTVRKGTCIRSGAVRVGSRCCRRRCRRSRPGGAAVKNIRSGTWGRGCATSAIPCAPGGRMFGVGRH